MKDKKVLKILDQLKNDREKICHNYTGLSKDAKKRVDKWKKSFFQIGDILAILSKDGWEFHEGMTKQEYVVSNVEYE